MNENINNNTAEENEEYSIEEELRAHERELERHEALVLKYDVSAGIIIILIGLFFVIGGYRMPLEALTGDPSKWYLSPGFMPMFCGGALILFSLMLIIGALRKGVHIEPDDGRKALGYLKSKKFFRLVLAALFLCTYLFVMLRRLDYFVATAIYIVTNMIVFTTKPRNVKNIIFYILISLIAAGAITYGFGTLAQIPLP